MYWSVCAFQLIFKLLSEGALQNKMPKPFHWSKKEISLRKTIKIPHSFLHPVLATTTTSYHQDKLMYPHPCNWKQKNRITWQTSYSNLYCSSCFWREHKLHPMFQKKSLPICCESQKVVVSKHAGKYSSGTHKIIRWNWTDSEWRCSDHCSAFFLNTRPLTVYNPPSLLL